MANHHVISTRILCLMFVVGLGFSNDDAAAQSKVRGVVVDANGAPLPNANVLLLKPKDSSLVKGAITTKDGSFIFEKVSPGSYLVGATFIGYKQVYSPTFNIPAKSNEEPLTIKLLEKDVTLSNVTVIARKPLFEQTIDRMVINVANNITAAGTTALDVLERSPGVLVDRQNNSLAINGKDGVVLMINGKINYIPLASVVRMLAGMPSDNVEKIELITTPPANLDAQGNAGYINIVLKSNSQYGTNGSYSITAGYSKGEILEGSVNINHRKGKVNLYGGYSFTHMRWDQLFAIYHAVKDQGRFMENDSESRRKAIEPIHDFRIGLDYDVKKNLVLGTLITVYRRGWLMDAKNNSSVLINQHLDTSVNIIVKEDHPTFSYDINLNLQKTIKEGEKLSANLDYMHYLDENPVSYLNSFYNGDGRFLYDENLRSDKKTPIGVWVSTIDYSRKLSKKVDIEAGLKATISDFTNRVQVDKLQQGAWIPDNVLTATSYLKENISAAYSSVNWALSDKTKMKAGLRYEYTNSNLGTATVKNIIDRHYGNLFPSFFLSHTINENSSANFSYSRRITRPSFWNLAPFVIFMDPNTYFSGNPALQPSITDNVNASYTYKKKIVSVSYSFEDNPITNFSPKVDPKTNKQTLAAENQDNQKTVNINFSMPIDITKWWTLQANVNGSFQQLNGLYNGEPILLEQKNFMINASQNFRLPKDFTLSVSSFYSSTGLWGIYRFPGMGTLDFRAQKKLSNQKSTLRLNFGNILNTLIATPEVDLPEKNLVVRSKLIFMRPSVRLTFSHNFGSDKVKEKETGQRVLRMRRKG